MRQYLDDVGLVNNVIAMVEKKFMVSNAVKLLPNNASVLLINDNNETVYGRNYGDLLNVLL